MATWKEKGIVPDSDDEEECDSGSSGSKDGPVIDDPDDGFLDIAEILKSGEAGILSAVATGTERDGLPTEGVLSACDLLLDVNQVEDVLAENRSSTVDKPTQVLENSQSTTEVANRTKGQDASDGRLEGNTKESTAPGPDEISRSWVRAVSPATSILSSPPMSQMSRINLLSKSFSQSRDITSKVVEEPSTELPALGRQFRKRKAIQMHPFLVEQKKYEERMKASHIRPLKIAQAEERHPRRLSKGGEKHSQATASQGSDDGDFDVEDSQPAIFDRNSLPPKSPRVQVVIAARSDDQPENEHLPFRDASDDDSDELPDLQDLLQNTRTQMRSKLPRTYSKKSARQPMTIATPAFRREEPPDILHVPSLSPLMSSPPMRPAQQRRARAVSVSSRQSQSPWIDESSPGAFQTVGASRAVTNITGAVPNSSLSSLSDVETLGPLTVPPSSSSSSSDDEEAIRIRRLGKRVRGVLPASHLRLDLRVRPPVGQRGAERESHTVPEHRLGVARALVRSSTSPATPNQARFPSLSIYSDESDPEPAVPDDRIETDSLYPESRWGIASEDDHIDAMLPISSRKRGAPHSIKRHGIKRAMTSTFRERQGSHLVQQRITDRFPKPGLPAQKNVTSVKRRRRKSPPMLSILDVVQSPRDNHSQPQFLKVAARNARSRKDLGRQRLGQKFIRLATREDTADAYSVLEQWAQRRIQPRKLVGKPVRPTESYRSPLGEVTTNYPARTSSTIVKIRRTPGSITSAHKSALPKVNVTGTVQRLESDRVTSDGATSEQSVRQFNAGDTNFERKRQQGAIDDAPNVRLAQLEASEDESSRRFPVAAFKKTKRLLDSLYRRGRKQPVQTNNLLLNRFLADDDEDVRCTIDNLNDGNEEAALQSAPDREILAPSRRKRAPRRLDANAAIYRQPSEPVIQDYFSSVQVESEPIHGKLLGLGKFGTKYPSHFDIIPLQAGIFFHESTFIGSCRLSNATHGELDLLIEREGTSITIDDKTFRWSFWDENVSSEIGVCFDWIYEQMLASISLTTSSRKGTATGIITHVVDYVQTGISFTNPQDKLGFIHRMSEILQDFSRRLELGLNVVGNVAVTNTIEVMVITTVLLIQVLRLSRHVGQQASARALEATLQDMVRSCIRLLLSQGFDGINKLYDDLQYLSVRESGIREDQYLVQAWVILMKVMEAAKIPRGSFWDLANLQLLETDINSINDARDLEKVWYSMFTLLPLFRFDESGVVMPGQQRLPAADNWALSQRLLKRVFTLYITDARQSPSFNDYCRALISRCHHLMVEWGWWKCNALIGTLFDFFASQKLAHLRNEEVVRSPQFLQELDTEPSLAIEVEDRSFHIFLKIVGVAIKHMRETEDVKGIRNLITRITPNHDRQYPKDEAIRERDLASLRNHHDLLCTMYWAAPVGQGLLLVLLQKLVAAENSHNEAFAINLQSWTNLARFVFSRSPQETPLDAIQALAAWQNEYFSSLLLEFLEAELQVQRQLEALPENLQTSALDSDFKSIVDSNRKSTMASIRAAARAMVEPMRAAHPMTARKAMNLYMLTQTFASRPMTCELDQELISSGIELLQSYLVTISRIAPTKSAQGSAIEEEDSQGFTGWDAGMEDDLQKTQFVEDCVLPLSNSVAPVLASRIRKLLYEEFLFDHGASNAGFLERVVVAWAGLASLLVRYEIFTPKVFLTQGIYTIFQSRHKSREAAAVWPLFLSEFFRKAPLVDFELAGFDIDLEWMIAILKPQPMLIWENLLSGFLLQKHHFLLTGQAFVDDRSLIEFSNQKPSTAKNQQLLKTAIANMQRILAVPTLVQSIFGDVPQTKVRDRFSRILTAVMSSMQQHLQMLSTTDTEAHKHYVVFVQGVACQIHSHCKDICPLADFFFHTSAEYWPEETDPTLYLAGLTSYTLQLSTNSGSTKTQLFYYLWNGLKRSLSTSESVELYVSRIVKAAREWEFWEFLLVDIAPAALQAALVDQGGWLVCEVYLVAVSRAMANVLASGKSDDAVVYITILLKQMLNGLSSLYRRHGHTVEGVHINHQGIIAVICRFWSASSPLLVEHNMSSNGQLTELIHAFTDFTAGALMHFEHSTPLNMAQAQFSIGRVGNPVALSEIINDVDKNWQTNVSDGEVCVQTHEGTHSLRFTNGPRNLGEILGGAMYRFGWGGQVPSLSHANEFIDNVFF